MNETGNNNAIVDLFSRYSAFERLEPVMYEMQWFMRGCENPTEHVKLLPDYCYAIFDMLRRTYFKVLPKLPEVISYDKEHLPVCQTLEEAKQVLEIDWLKFGRVIGMGLRCLRFAEFEMKSSPEFKGLANLPTEKQEMFFELLVGSRWLQRKHQEFPDNYPAKLEKENVEKSLAAFIEHQKCIFLGWGEVAYKWSPEAMAEFQTGMAEGMKGWMDETGQFVGESNRGPIYWWLIILWPEIKEMQASQTKTRNDLAELIQPLVEMELLSCQAVGQLNDVCEDIHLKIKGPGAPRKAE